MKIVDRKSHIRERFARVPWPPGRHLEMERNLLLLSLALGGVVWFFGFLSSVSWGRAAPPTPAPLPRFWLITALAVPVIVFLATLPTTPPLFAPGHAMGTGFLIGGLAGTLAIWTILRAVAVAHRSEPVSASAAIAAPIGLALLVATIPSLVLRSDVVDALAGIAIGWLCAVIIALCSQSSQWQTRATAAAQACLALAAGAGAIFCTLAALGELRGHIDLIGRSTAVVHWAAPGLAFNAFLVLILTLVLLPATIALRIPLVSLLTGWIERSGHDESARAYRRSGLRVWFCGAVAIGLGSAVSKGFTEHHDALWKTKSPLLKPLFALIGPSPMFHVILVGVLAALIITRLIWDQARLDGESESGGRRTILPNQPNFLAGLTLAAAGMLAFQSMGGFGLSILAGIVLIFAALTCAGALSGLHEQVEVPTDTSSTTGDWELLAAADIVRLALLGIVLALYRLFSVRFDSELRGVGLTDHYALFGVIFGAALPPFLTRYFKRIPPGSTDSDGRRLFRAVVTGLILLVIPTVIVAFWGAKCVLALFIGLAISVLFEGSLLSALLAVAIALALAQWAHHVLPLAALTRDQKVNVLGWTAAVSIIALLVAEYSGRARSPAARQPTTEPVKGGAQ